MSIRSRFGSYAKRLADRLRPRFGLAASSTTQPFRFVRLALPCGREYELSIESEDPDAYHRSVSTGDLKDCTWQFIYNWINQGDVFFDLGANIGVIAIPGGVKGAQVHAFELLYSNASHLARAVERNALHDFYIVVGPVSDRTTFLSSRGASAWAEAKSNGTMMFPTVVIDDYVRERSIRRVDMMKIDVEGSEQAALLGARATIERDHPDIVIECNALTCGNHGHSYRQLLQTLTGSGYAVYRIADRQLAPWRADAVQETILADYLASARPANEIVARIGFPIRELSDSQVLDSLVAQERYTAFHKQYCLLIIDRLPQHLREDETVQRLRAQWQLLADDRVLSVLRRGSA